MRGSLWYPVWITVLVVLEASAIDYFSYLEAWLEQGKAPDRIIGPMCATTAFTAHMTNSADQKESLEIKLRGAAFGLKIPLDPAIPVAFTRPIYPYPLLAKYRGTGDPNDAANFVPSDWK